MCKGMHMRCISDRLLKSHLASLFSCEILPHFQVAIDRIIQFLNIQFPHKQRERELSPIVSNKLQPEELLLFFRNSGTKHMVPETFFSSCSSVATFPQTRNCWGRAYYVDSKDVCGVQIWDSNKLYHTTLLMLI